MKGKETGALAGICAEINVTSLRGKKGFVFTSPIPRQPGITSQNCGFGRGEEITLCCFRWTYQMVPSLLCWAWPGDIWRNEALGTQPAVYLLRWGQQHGVPHEIITTADKFSH